MVEPAPPGHRPRKRFGQNFLHDTGVIHKIVRAVAPRASDAVVEIGPGKGALSRPLLEACGALDVVEIDRDLAGRLEAQALPGLRIHQSDALTFDFCALSRERGQPLRVVGNLPYNISTPLMFHLLDQSDCIGDLHLMLQREVVQRMAAAPGGKDYGRLSVMVQWRCRVEMLFGVASGAFQPRPKVASAVVRLTPHGRAPVDVGDGARFQRLVTQAFSHRRKTLRNALGNLIDVDQMQACGIDPRARPETLDLAEYACLSRALGAGPQKS